MFRNFFRSQRAGVAVISALSLPGAVTATGGAIDFGRVVQLHDQIQDAADDATLSTIAVNSAAYKAGVSMNADGTISGGSTKAVTGFTAGYTPPGDVSNVTTTATVTKTGTVMTANMTIKATYKTYILGLIGIDTVPITVTSTSTATVPPYIDFYLLLDNTPSMGVGATTADINTMVSNTPDQCAFACHEGDKPGTDYYAKAKSLGVTTRIDVVRKATQDLMTTATSTETLSNQYRMAIYDFGAAADAINQTAPTAYKVSSLTANLSQSSSDAGTIDLMTIPYQNYNSDRQSNFISMLSSMNTNISASGDGASSANPQKVLFFVSDGTNDGYDCGYTNGNSCRRITPIDITTCTALKARGVRIAVLYTTYLPLPTNSFYNSWVAKYVSPSSQIASQMQSCASPGLYFEVSPSQGISTAMTALFKRIVSVVRINA
ncbi:TadE/TadG family type IV pilus assembly protein [Asticcacaulis solisilvae]|uniref:TadE/TadG family type IV pilus assembly protein n=1 Tax=Asticcacaulis solisilvae TaxID=1217274 RepID=UPI003FD7419C